MRAESLAFFKSLIQAASPSGYEEPAAKVYREYTGGFADEVRTDIHGSVWAILNPEAKTRIMFAGHMDEIGFQIHHVDSDGLCWFRGIGGHDRCVPVGQAVWVHTKNGRVPGVIGRKPIHLLEEAERGKSPQLHDMWIDIGATSKEEALEAIELGDCVTYHTEFIELLNDRVTGRGMDNRSGSFIVAEALRLLKEDGGLDPNVGVYAVATVQEEIGLRGARTAAFGVDPITGLAVDVDFAIDTPGLSKTRYGDAKIGGGPTIARGANVNPVTYRLLLEAAKAEDIPLQLAPEAGATGTDANAMQVSRAGMATGLVGLPLRYMHTPVELCSLKDVEDTARLMAAYCRQVTPETDFTPGS